MKPRYIFFLLLLLLSYRPFAQPYLKGGLRSGDLLFQNLDCGPLCEAIEQVTQAYGDYSFSHIGLIYVAQDTVWVIEAIGEGVKKTLLPAFLSRGKHEVLLGRLKKPYRTWIDTALFYAQNQLGVAYDEAFLYDNNKYYCSELIYDAFKFANQGTPVFVLEPMTFKRPGTDHFFKAWEDYYQDLKMEIPEGQPGINPGGISRSPLLKMFRIRHW